MKNNIFKILNQSIFPPPLVYKESKRLNSVKKVNAASYPEFLA